MHGSFPSEAYIMKQSIAVNFGEFLGTFILVYFGTAIVSVSVLFNAPLMAAKSISATCECESCSSNPSSSGMTQLTRDGR